MQVSVSCVCLYSRVTGAKELISTILLPDGTVSKVLVARLQSSVDWYLYSTRQFGNEH